MEKCFVKKKLKLNESIKLNFCYRIHVSCRVHDDWLNVNDIH